MIIAVVAGALLLSLVGAFTVYSNDLLNLELVRDRASRYPTAMAWLSGFLAEANLFEWRDYFYTDTSFYRLLTALTMSCLAFGLALDKRWRHHPLPVALAAAAILTVPNIHYHASLLYLDLPVVVATTLLLLDIRHLVRSEAQHLPANSSWWLLLLLGMFKESAAPILAVVLGARCLCQFWRCRTGAISCKRLVMQEILVALAALGPLMLYLAIRYQFGARAYGAEFGNLFDVGLWAKGLTAIGQQSGTILLAGIAGLWVLWRQHRRMEALLLVALFFGLKAFFLVDSDSYVGLARFNLYVLPPVLVLAWEAYTALFARRQVLALGAAAALLATNLAMSPVHLNGDRDSDYGESTEAWYPFDQVIQDLSLTTPQARIALANAEVDYSLNILTSQQHWGVDTRLLPPFSDNDSENLPRSLEAAEKQEVTVVIYRFEGLPASPPPATIGLWQLHSTASGTGGMLAVYSR